MAEFPDLKISDYGGIDAALDTMREMILEWMARHSNFVPEPLSYDKAYSLCADRNEDIAAERIKFQGLITLELPAYQSSHQLRIYFNCEQKYKSQKYFFFVRKDTIYKGTYLSGGWI